jgi:hypothetical protein
MLCYNIQFGLLFKENVSIDDSRIRYYFNLNRTHFSDMSPIIFLLILRRAMYLSYGGGIIAITMAVPATLFGAVAKATRNDNPFSSSLYDWALNDKKSVSQFSKYVLALIGWHWIDGRRLSGASRQRGTRRHLYFRCVFSIWHHRYTACLEM